MKTIKNQVEYNVLTPQKLERNVSRAGLCVCGSGLELRYGLSSRGDSGRAENRAPRVMEKSALGARPPHAPRGRDAALPARAARRPDHAETAVAEGAMAHGHRLF